MQSKPEIHSLSHQRNVLRWLNYAEFYGCPIYAMDPLVVLIVQEGRKRQMTDLPSLDFLNQYLTTAQESMMFYGVSQKAVYSEAPFIEIAENMLYAERKRSTVKEMLRLARRLDLAIMTMFTNNHKEILDLRKNMADKALETDRSKVPGYNKSEFIVKQFFDDINVPLFKMIQSPSQLVFEYRLLIEACFLRCRAMQAERNDRANSGPVLECYRRACETGVGLTAAFGKQLLEIPFDRQQSAGPSSSGVQNNLNGARSLDLENMDMHQELGFPYIPDDDFSYVAYNPMPECVAGYNPTGQFYVQRRVGQNAADAVPVTTSVTSNHQLGQEITAIHRFFVEREKDANLLERGFKTLKEGSLYLSMEKRVMMEKAKHLKKYLDTHEAGCMEYFRRHSIPIYNREQLDRYEEGRKMFDEIREKYSKERKEYEELFESYKRQKEANENRRAGVTAENSQMPPPTYRTIRKNKKK